MEQLDSLIATSSWSSALQHVHQHSLDPSYIPYLAQQQFLSTPSNQLDLATFNSLLNQINDPEWIASACYKLARESDHLPLVKAAIREGRKATDKVVEGYEELQLAVEEKDVEGVRELCSLDEGVRKVCLIEKGLIELGDRARTWEEIWGGAEEEKEKVAEKEGAEGTVKDDTKTDDDDEAAAWGSLDIPSSPSPRPSTPPTTSTPPCSLSTFLTEPLDDPSLSLAATSSLAPLLTLITRHSTLLWPLRTQLLHAIPEWEEPSSYLPLLTGVSPTDGREIKWVGQPWRAEPEFLEKVFEAPQPGEEDLEDRRTAEELTRVYRERIESVAEMGLVSVALGLVQHCASVEVPGLEELGEELSLLSRLVYDRPPPSSEQEEEDEGPYTLTHWRSRSPSQILALYLSTSTPSTIAPTIRRLVLPYLSVLESRLERSGTPDPSLPARLLNEWILALASSSTKGTPIDRLKLIESIFQNSKPTLPLPQRLVRNDEDLARLALSILYGSTESTSEALVLMGKIFECLPAFPDSSAGVKVPPALFDIFSLYPPTTPPPPPSTLFAHLAPLPPSTLSHLLDTLDLHLTTSESFSRYSCPVPPHWFLLTHWDPSRQRAWATRLARTAAKGSAEEGEGGFEGEDEWVGLMEEMVGLTEGAKEGLGEGAGARKEESVKGMGKAFWLLERREVLGIFFGGLLGAGRISLARSLFSGSSSLSPSGLPTTPPLEPKMVEELVIAASREFYDNAEEGNVNRGEMKLALECLSAAPQTPLIRTERDFILATSQLCSYNLTTSSTLPLTPIEIRLSKDRLSFVARLLASNEDAYKHPDVLLELVEKLGYRGDLLARVRTLAMVAEASLAAEEWEKTREVCERMCGEVEGMRKGSEAVTTPNTTATAAAAADSPDLSSRAAPPPPAPTTTTLYHSASDYAWRACFQLGKHEEWTDLESRLRAMGQALILCPGERIGGLLTVWEGLEERVGKGREERRSKIERREKAVVVQSEPPSSYAQQDPTPVAASRTFSRAAAFFPFSTSTTSTTSDRTSSPTRPPSSATADPSSPLRAGRGSSEQEREGGIRAGLSSRLTKGVGWLIGADEREFVEREGEGSGWE